MACLFLLFLKQLSHLYWILNRTCPIPEHLGAGIWGCLVKTELRFFLSSLPEIAIFSEKNTTVLADALNTDDLILLYIHNDAILSVFLLKLLNQSLIFVKC